MAKLTRIGLKIETVCALELSDDEVAALDALVGYGVESFLKVFYKHMGESYLSPHEAGLRSLFEAVRGCRSLTKAADECREFMCMEVEERLLAQKAVREKRLGRIG